MTILVRWPVVFSAAVKALTDPPPEWQGPAVARGPVEATGDFWDV